MLPKPTDPSFPEALKAARESCRLTFKQLAELAEISSVMPSRYENRGHSCFGPPSEKTWKKLNAVLCGDEEVQSAVVERLCLEDASVEEIVAELKFRRGALSVKIDF